MDIIATGISSATSDKVGKIIELIKLVKDQHGEKFKQKGIAYGNLFDYI